MVIQFIGCLLEKGFVFFKQRTNLTTNTFKIVNSFQFYDLKCFDGESRLKLFITGFKGKKKRNTRKEKGKKDIETGREICDLIISENCTVYNVLQYQREYPILLNFLHCIKHVN